MTNIEEGNENNPFDAVETYSDAESSEDEESKDTVGGLSQEKPTVNKDFANAKRFLSVTS